MPDLNRRQVIAGLGTVSLGALLAACSDDEAPRRASTSTTEALDDGAACTLTPEQTEGPYYFDVDSIRSDIREDREGVRLRLVPESATPTGASRSGARWSTSGTATR
jgi:hypothetical protein